MPVIESSYRAPRWLPGGHSQTIFAARMTPVPRVSYRRERWTTPDDDFIDVDFAQPEPEAASAPLLIMFHGLEGCSQSHYARAVMRRFSDLGWRGIVVHFRGCSGEPNLLARAYHSGDSDEADWVLRKSHARWPLAKLHAVGISLGGNLLAKWLGERAEDAAFVTAAASVGSPLDLVAGGTAISQGINLLYGRMFLETLRVKALAKAAQFPGLAQPDAVRRARNLYEFDDAYTAPVHGFRNTLDYWTKASAKPLLLGVRVPHLALNARNDPFVPAASLPGPNDVSSAVVLEQPHAGGHIGFAEGGWPGRSDFLPRRLFEFFTRG